MMQMFRLKYDLLIRYGIVGICGGVIQTLALYIWVDILRLTAQYLLGAGIGFCIALLVTFSLQKYWTFRDNSVTDSQRQFVLYGSIAILNLMLNVLLLHVSKLLFEHAGLNFFDVWYIYIQIVIIALLAGASFLANYFVTFRMRV